MEEVGGGVIKRKRTSQLRRSRSRTAHLARSLMGEGAGKVHKDGKAVSDVLQSLVTEEE